MSTHVEIHNAAKTFRYIICSIKKNHIAVNRSVLFVNPVVRSIGPRLPVVILVKSSPCYAS